MIVAGRRVWRLDVLHRDLEGGDELEIRLLEELPAGTTMKILVRQRRGRTIRTSFNFPPSVVIVHNKKERKALKAKRKT